MAELVAGISIFSNALSRAVAWHRRGLTVQAAENEKAKGASCLQGWNFVGEGVFAGGTLNAPLMN
jgi:hypothetical protein